MGRQGSGQVQLVNRFLLDTHTLLWWWTDADRLGAQGRAALADEAATVMVSVASVWEIAIKTHSGKLRSIDNFTRDYALLMAANGFEALSITAEHALCAGYLPGTHRDPFDRMIAAQALIGDLTVITRDREIAGFGCKVVW